MFEFLLSLLMRFIGFSVEVTEYCKYSESLYVNAILLNIRNLAHVFRTCLHI